MSEYRKISTLCPAQPNVSSRSFADIKAEMSGWIRMNIDRVLPDSPDLIVLPECSSRYNCPAGVKYDDYKQQLKDYYRYVGDEFTQMLSRVAVENNTIIAYSAIRVADDSDKPFRNSTVYIGRSGEVIGIYDKNYLVIEENTLSDIAYGERAELIDLGFAKAATAICFDLNFDELLEDYAAMRPKLVVFSSMYHGGIRQAIWAYQCRSYLVSSTKGLPGAILDPFGRTIAAATNYLAYVTARVNFDFALCHLDHNWERFAAAKRKYGSALKVDDPGYIGYVLLSSEQEGLRIDEIIDEFGIERLDDYFARSVSARTSSLADRRQADGGIKA